MALYKHLFNAQREKENYDVDLVDTRIMRYDLRSKEDLSQGDNSNNSALNKHAETNENEGVNNDDDKKINDFKGNKILKSIEDEDLRNIKPENDEKYEIEKLSKIYNEHVYLTLEVASLICWRYHESQQKPKARGSADFSLKDLAVEVLEKDMQDDIRFGRIEMKEGKSDEFEIIDITDKIKKKIMNKVDNKILQEKGIIDEKGEIKIKDEEFNKKKKD